MWLTRGLLFLVHFCVRNNEDEVAGCEVMLYICQPALSVSTKLPEILYELYATESVDFLRVRRSAVEPR
jgi:hypothetical protein